MTGKIVKLGVALVVAAAALSSVAVRAADVSHLKMLKLQRQAKQYQKTQQYKNEVNRAFVKAHAIDGGTKNAIPSDHSRVFGELLPDHYAFSSSSGNPPPPASPGQELGLTSYDYQANNSQAFCVARLGGANGSGANMIHFTWMAFDNIPADIEDSDRVVRYLRAIDPEAYPAMNLVAGTGYNGVNVTGETNRGGYTNIDVDKFNHAQIGMHQSENDYTTDPYKPWHVQFPYLDETFQLYSLSGQDNTCPGSPNGIGGVLWPRIAADRGDTILHEIAHSNVNDCAQEKLWYWRFDGGSIWSGPKMISATDDINYAMAVDDIGNKVAVAYSKFGGGFANLYYVESNNNGTDWLALVAPNLPTENAVTTYGAGGNPGSPADASFWNHITTTYDRTSQLHIVWDEQRVAGETGDIALKHFRSGRVALRTVTLGYWECPVSTGLQDLNLAKVSMGIGDGSVTCSGSPNTNYVYVTYTQFGGNTALELSDYSDEASVTGRTGGYMNGELYIAMSNTLGDTWSPTRNLTNTKTPGCNPGVADVNGDPQFPDDVCRSEHWATINRVVRDADISFISDLDAAGIVYGQGSWQMNPVHYLQLKGTSTATGVCPVIAPVFASILEQDPTCEYHAPTNSTLDLDLQVINLGNAALNQGSGSGIYVATPFGAGATLSIVGGNTPAYSIAAGGADLNKVVRATSGATEGLYTGAVGISHNDPNVLNPSPRLYPIDFFVFDVFFCPEEEVLKTGVASPGSLSLHIESSGRIAAQDAEGRMWRYSDSSFSVSDASLLLAYGTQAAGDTTVFLKFMDRQSNGQDGFRSQSDLQVDTAAYSSGANYAFAGAYMSTKDSVMGVTMSWYFPQSPSMDEAIIVNYLVYPGPSYSGGTVNNVTTGLIADMDQLPAQRNGLDTLQAGTNNSAFFDDGRKLLYVRGKNKPGTVVVGTNTAERFRAGIAAPSGWEGGFIGSFAADLGVANGPSDQRLYEIMTNVSGGEIAAGVNDTDLYVLTGFKMGATIGPVGGGLTYRTTNVLSHTAVFASDTISDVNFKATIDAAVALVNAGSLPFTRNADISDGCAICPCRFDPACDGVTDVLDVVHIVAGAFRNVVADPSLLGTASPGDERPTMAGCNFDSRDVDASGVIDVLDVVKGVGVAFRNINFRTATGAGPSFVDPCTKFREWNP
jgi:hypothetical protein